MTVNFINYFKKFIYLVVLIGFGLANAGSYDDFFKALRTDDVVTVNNLLARGFDVNTLDPQGQHGLIVAIKEPSPKVAKALVNALKIDLNALNVLGESPLMLACLNGELELATQMVKKGADVNKTGWTPLHYAASKGHLSVIKLLLENYAYIDAESPNGTTPLMMASMYGTTDAVNLLLGEGADPLLKNQQGLTALQFAQRASRPDAAEILTKVMRSKQASGKW
jgi:hypothetical protein